MSNKVFFTEIEGKYSFEIPRDGFTMNLPNTEFSEDFFTNWTYPVSLYMTDELKRTFGDITNENFVLNRSYDNGYINIEGKLHLCRLRFMSVDKGQIKIQFEFGIENLPSFDKPLSEFDYGTIDVPNIYDYVNENLDKKYPESVVFFPMVHTDKYKEIEVNNSFFFPHIYNYTPLTPTLNTSVKVRENELTENGYKTKNIIKPYISLIHILKTCFAKDGYTLKGDILEDEEFKDSAVFNQKEMFDKYVQDVKTLNILEDGSSNETEEFYFASLAMKFYYIRHQSKTETFNVLGTYYLSILTTKLYVSKIKCKAKWIDEDGNNQSVELNFNEDEENYVLMRTDELELIELLPVFNKETKVTIEVETILFIEVGKQKSMDFCLNPKRAEGDEGTKQEWYIPLNKVILSEYVPEMSFGDILGILKKWKNYKLIPRGKDIFMNLAKEELPEDVVNLEFTEVKIPPITFNKNEAYVLKMETPEDSEQQIMTITKNEFFLEEKKFKNKINLNINGYPLPMKTVRLITTAHEEDDSYGGLALIKYKGLQSNRNVCSSLDNLNLQPIFNEYYRIGLKNRLNAHQFKWTFIGTHHQLKNLKSTDIIYAYKHFHKIKNIQKKLLGKHSYQITFDTENRF